jgi:siroheme decarboxylase
VAAVAAHRRLGYLANGMAVFRVADDRIDGVGAQLARRSEVTHCYRRPPLPGWPYNLFAMIHGHTQHEVRAFVQHRARELDLTDFEILFSIKEYKKVSMTYF